MLNRLWAILFLILGGVFYFAGDRVAFYGCFISAQVWLAAYWVVGQINGEENEENDE